MKKKLFVLLFNYLIPSVENKVCSFSKELNLFKIKTLVETGIRIRSNCPIVSLYISQFCETHNTGNITVFREISYFSWMVQYVFKVPQMCLFAIILYLITSMKWLSAPLLNSWVKCYEHEAFYKFTTL